MYVQYLVGTTCIFKMQTSSQKNHRPKKMVTAFSIASAFAGQFSPSNLKGLDGRVRSESIQNRIVAGPQSLNLKVPNCWALLQLATLWKHIVGASAPLM